MPFLPGLSPVGGKPVQLAFHGGRLTSEAGVLLAEIERRLKLAERLARCLTGRSMVELFCNGFEQVLRRIILDIDDICDPAHGGQELSLFHAHYGERCFLAIHVYEAVSGKPVAVILRPGKLPDGAEVMAWCGRNRVAYLLGVAGNKVLLARVAGLAEDAAGACLEGEAAKVRHYDDCGLLYTLRGLAPKASYWHQAQPGTLRLAFIKVAARVTRLATRIKLALASGYPRRDSLALLAARADKPP